VQVAFDTAFVKVDVVPQEAQRLALSQNQRQGE